MTVSLLQIIVVAAVFGIAYFFIDKKIAWPTPGWKTFFIVVWAILICLWLLGLVGIYPAPWAWHSHHR